MNPPLREKLVHEVVNRPEKEPSINRSFRKRAGVMIFFFFSHTVIDIFYVPILSLLIIIGPWRVPGLLYKLITFDFNTEKNFNEQLKNQRSLIVKQFVEAWIDLVTTLKLIVVLVAIIRLPFFFLIILKNRFPNSALSKRLFYEFIVDKAYDKKLTWRRCIQITFKETMRDIGYVPFALIIILIAPWRIVTIVSIYWSQTDRIPTQDIEAKKLKLSSRRHEILKLFVVILRHDFICLLRAIFITLTIYRLPSLLKILYTYLTQYYKYSSGVSKKKL